MSTKITRKDADKMLFDLSKNIASIIMESGCVVADKFMTSHSYIDKGNSTEEFFCQACGSTHLNVSRHVHYGYGYSTSSATCPTCGNKHYTNSRSHRSSKFNMFVREISDGFEFALYHKVHNFPELVDDWYMHEPEVSVSVCNVGRFDKENGWYCFDVSVSKLLSRNSMAEQTVLESVKRLLPENVIEGDFATMLAEATVYEAKKAAQNAAKKASSKTTLLEEMRQAYKPKEIDPDEMAHIHDHIFYDLYSTKNKKVSYMACCTKCGHIFETAEYEAGTNIQLTCPSCGFHESEVEVSTYRSSRSSVHDYFAVFENTNLPENDLLIRVFKVDKSFSTTYGYKAIAIEVQRIFCGKKMNVYLKHSHYSGGSVVYSPNFEKATIRDVSSSLIGWRVDAVVTQSDEELAKIIRNSCLMYSGLVESYSIGDKRYNGYEKAPSLKYLMAWYKKPEIELILKANMTTILEHMIHYPEHIGTGTTLAEALNVHPYVAKIATKLNLNYEQLQELSVLYNTDNTITDVSYLEIVNLDVPVASIARLKSQFNIDYKQAIQYLDSAYNNQCIERREALVQWLDYLRMATALRIDLTDKTRLYPGSLKKEHDVASFAYKAIQIEVDKEKFAAQAKENEFYEYSYKDLIVVVPKTPQDIVEEATRQRNCLRSYVERVKNGDTVVAFVRRKVMPNATYVTAEIHEGELIQLKGYCNSDPRNKELVEFVQHWAKAKNIVVKC